MSILPEEHLNLGCVARSVNKVRGFPFEFALLLTSNERRLSRESTTISLVCHVYQYWLDRYQQLGALFSEMSVESLPRKAAETLSEPNPHGNLSCIMSHPTRSS